METDTLKVKEYNMCFYIDKCLDKVCAAKTLEQLYFIETNIKHYLDDLVKLNEKRIKETPGP